MIESIELKNFKSIKKKYFPLRKLNLLLGLNGMGKSSFIQSLLLLKQSNIFDSKYLDLNRKDSYVKIGTTKDARYQYSKKDEDVSIALQFKGDEAIDMKFGYEIESDVMPIKNITFDLLYDLHQKYKSQSLFSNNFQYLNANRIPPTSNHPKSYTNVVRNRNIGNYGEFTVHFIETYYNDEVEFTNLLHKDSKTKDELLNTQITNKTLINQINLWMGEISPGINIKTTSISSEEVLLEYTFKQRNFGNTSKFKPENVGFGVSYSLHVVTALLAAKPGELIIIENPESHVHPKGQAEIGKLIALTAMNDVQIIVETHSDHVINGIRVAIKDNPTLKDETILFYFDKKFTESEQYSQITDIKMDKNGTLSEEPHGLLDEWGNQLLKLL